MLKDSIAFRDGIKNYNGYKCTCDDENVRKLSKKKYYELLEIAARRLLN
ncbi:MAG: hypothetical protein LBF68_04625 [Christensenellaceae bacterium]|jgi:hypothetical protein|nr:hypothetical protein [Christensenellaceae bacterium]